MWGQVSAALERDQDGEPAFAVTMIENITKRKRAEVRADPPGRAERAPGAARPAHRPAQPAALRRADRAARSPTPSGDGTRLAIVMMDLDRFKEVNDSLGHKAGDELLEEVGERLRGALRAVGHRRAPRRRRVRPAAAEPIRERRRARDDRARPRALERPDRACRGCRSRSRPRSASRSSPTTAMARAPDPARRRRDVRRQARERAVHFLRRGPDECDATASRSWPSCDGRSRSASSCCTTSPRPCSPTATVRSVEALVRWQHPDARADLSRTRSSRSAQETGLIRPLTLYVLDEALRQCRAWRDEGLELVGLGEPLDAQPARPRVPEPGGASCWRRWELEPDLLELELTESAMLANPKRTKAVLTELSALGVRLSIDDFGTGYSSLAYLRQLPIDEIKIDRSFVIEHERARATDLAIVRSHDRPRPQPRPRRRGRGRRDAARYGTQLRALGCTSAQGYFLSPPLPPGELSAWLRERRAARGVGRRESGVDKVSSRTPVCRMHEGGERWRRTKPRS